MVIHRPSSIVHRPSSIVHRPSSIVHHGDNAKRLADRFSGPCNYVYRYERDQTAALLRFLTKQNEEMEEFLRAHHAHAAAEQQNFAEKQAQQTSVIAQLELMVAENAKHIQQTQEENLQLVIDSHDMMGVEGTVGSKEPLRCSTQRRSHREGRGARARMRVLKEQCFYTWVRMRFWSEASHRIASHRIASHRIASHRIASHRIASHRIASHRIASHRYRSRRF
jgi:hypothetical protein